MQGKRVLILSLFFEPEDFVINDFVHWMSRQGHKVDVVTQNPSYPAGRSFVGYGNPWLAKSEDGNLTTYRLKAVFGYRASLSFKLFGYVFFVLAATLFLLFRYLRRADAVFVYQAGPLTMALPAVVYARLYRVPITIWSQDIWPDAVFAYGFPRISCVEAPLKAFVRFVYRQCSEIVVSSPGFVDSISHFVNKRITLVENWPLQRYEISIRQPGLTPAFLYAGNLGKLQNLENVIRGFAEMINTSGSLCSLMIVGDGSRRTYLQDLSRQIGAPVQFTGRIPALRMAEYYEQADVLVLPLIDNNEVGKTIPSKYQTYLSVGKPIFSVGPAVLNRRISEDRVGIVAAASDVHDIANGFKEMLDALPTMRHSWASNARHIYLERYSPDQLMLKLQGCIVKR